MMLKFTRENIYLIIIVFAISISVFSNLYSLNGGVSPDSGHYLSIAQNLIEGNGFFSSKGNGFAIFGLGYPTLIALVSLLTGASVVIASKILNILLILFSIFLLKKYTKKKTYLFALIFTLEGNLMISSYTWSENLFIFSLIILSISIYEFVNKDNPKIINYIMLIVSALLSFFSRHIGAFTFGLIGLLSAYYLFNRKFSILIKLILSMITCFFTMVIVLQNNYKLTGYYTGMPRIPAPETNLEMIKMLIKALQGELILFSPVASKFFFPFLIFELIVIAIVLIFKNKNVSYKKTTNKKCVLFRLEFIFFIVGLTHLFFITYARWTTHFDSLSYRFFTPSTTLILFAVLIILEKKAFFERYKLSKVMMFLFSFLSFTSTFCLQRVNLQEANNINYYQNIAKLKNDLNQIPKNSTINFGDYHIKYLRTDLKITQPRAKPYHEENESWDEFIDRTYQNNLYIDCYNAKKYMKHKKLTCHTSIKNKIEKYTNNNYKKRFKLLK